MGSERVEMEDDGLKEGWRAQDTQGRDEGWAFTLQNVMKTVLCLNLR